MQYQKASKRNKKHLGASKSDFHFVATIGNRISSGNNRTKTLITKQLTEWKVTTLSNNK